MSSIILLLLLLFVNGILTGPGTIELPDFFWSGRPVQEVLKKCAQKTGYIVKNPNSYREAYCLEKPEEEACFTKCILEETQLVLKEVVYIEEGIKNIANNKRWSPYDNRLEGARNLLKECTKQYKYNLNDIACVREEEFAHCLFLKHYLYPNIDDFFCKKMVDIPVSLNSLVEIANTRHCPLWLTKPGDIFCVNEVLDGDECLAYCIFVQAKILHDERQKIGMVDIFFKANRPFQRDHVIQVQTDLLLTRCWTLMLKQRKKWCQRSVYLKDCIKKYHKTYKFGSADCETNMTKELIMVAIMPNQLKAQDVFDSCYEIHKVQFIRLREIFKEDLSKCEVIMCALQGLEFARMNKEINTAKIMNNLIDMHFIKSNSITYNKIKKLLSICTRPIDQCIDAMLVLKCIRENALQYGLKNNTLEYNPFFIPHMYDIFQITDNIFDILKTCKSSDNRTLVRPGDLYNIQGTEYKEIRLCLLKQMNIFHKNGSLNLEVTLKTIKQRRIYRPKLPREIRFLQLKALVKNCANKRDYDETYYCLVKRRLEYGFEEYMSYPPFLKMSLPLRFFVNDSINVDDCYNKTGHKLYYPSDIFAFSASHEINVAGLSQCIIEKQEYWPIPEDGFKEVYLDSLVSRKIMTYEEMTLVRSIMMVCKANFNVTCLKKKSNRFGFDPEIEFDPFLKLNLTLSDLLSFRKDDEEVLSVCKTDTLSSSRDIFNVNDDPDLIHCIFENHDLFDNQGFNIERILKSLVDNGKAIRNSAVYNQIKAMLLICKANTSTEVKDCLVKNNDRFGLIPIVNFNPNFKIGLGLTDLLIKNNENKTLEHCRTLTKFPLRNFMDVFNIKKPEEEPYLECLLIRFGILKNKKLDVKEILERVNMTKNTTKHMNLQSFLEKCQNFTTGAYQIRNCFMENYLRFGFYKYPDFDAQLQLNKSFDDMMTGNKMAILKKCQSGIGLYKIIDIFNLDTVKFKHIIECVFRETLMINKRMIDPNAILKSLYGAHYKPHSPEAIQIRTFLKLCCPLPLNTGKMIKCFKENGERFGFKKLLEFYPDVKYINHISSYLGLNEKVNKSDKCYQESGLELQLAVDIFAIENYTDPIKKTLMDCILKAYDVTKGDRLNVKALLDLNRKEIKDKHWTNLKTLIYYCNNKTDIIKCLREDAMRFGFAKVIDFDPFLKTNLSLADFLNPKKNDKYIVEICNQKERLVASKDIFNLKGSELLVNCIFDNYNIFTKNKLNIDGILKMFVDNEKVKENDEIYKQIKAFLRMCDSRFPINVRDCLRSNNLRFGFKKFTQFNPLLHLGISLNDLLKEKEHESVNECQKLSDSPIKNIYDVFNTKSNTEEKYIECLLTYFNIMIDSKLAIDGILARQNWTEKDEEYKNMKSFLEECNQFTKAIEIKECFLQNYLRFGFDQLPDFDPQLKFEQNLGDFMIIHDKEEILTTCSDNNTRPIFEIVDVFNLNTTKYPIFIKCVLENTKIIANNTLDMETMLKSIFRNKPVLSSSIEMTQMRTFLKTCNKKPLLLAKLIKCLKENGERFGLQPLLEFEPDLKFDDTISVYLGITPFHIDNKRCYKESKLELQKPEDIFSIERYTDESIRELIRCLFKNYEVIDDELINVEAILKWNKKNLSKKLQNKLKVFLNLCNNTVEPIICLQAYRERFNFKPAMDFDPFLKLDIELEDFLDSNTDEKEILQSCKNSVLGTSKDIFNVRNKTDLVKCIFEKHKIFDREDGLKVDNILKTLMKHEKIETNSKSYRQINTLLQLCSLKTADEVRQCLIENNNRFGLLKRLSFDPSIKVTLQLTDFLNPVENVTGCQSMVYDPIYDPKDVFSIKHNVDDAYIYCLFTHFNIMKNSQLQIKAILDHLNLSETDKQYNNIKSLLNECEEYSGPIDLKNCFVKNYLRFGFSKLPDFDPQFKVNKDLDVLMIGNKKRILEKCTKGSERILFKAIDVFNLNMTKYPEMLTMATCILQESKILTRNGNLNINEMLLNAFGPKSNQNTGYYTNANSFLNICNGNGMNNVTTEEIITCFRKNVRRFGFNPLINFDPLLKFNKTLAPILGVKKHIHNITMCFKQSQLKLHNAVDIFVIEEHLLSNTKALITCVLVKNLVLRQNPLEIEKILMKNRDDLSEEHFGQLKAFLHLCNVDDDIMGCMKENLERFGFEREIQFDPFLKMNISLIDFFRVNTDEEKILKICNAEELLKKTEDIYVSCIEKLLKKDSLMNHNSNFFNQFFKENKDQRKKRKKLSTKWLKHLNIIRKKFNLKILNETSFFRQFF